MDTNIIFENCGESASKIGKLIIFGELFFAAAAATAPYGERAFAISLWLRSEAG